MGRARSNTSRRWRPTHIAIGQMRKLNRKGKLVKGNKITVPMNRASSTSGTSQNTLGNVTDVPRNEFEMLLGPDINVDKFLAVCDRQARRKKKRRKKKVSYIEKRQRMLQSWREHRLEIMNIYISGEVLLEDISCCKCTTAATHRCLECGVEMYYCTSHVQDVHQECLHVPEIWQDGHYQAVAVERTPWVRNDHFQTCETQKCKVVVVVDLYGRHHKVPVTFCSHEEPGVTLIRHRLWPSTISRTEVAFDFTLMDWMEVMYLECHVSCRSLCQALKLMGDKLPQHVKNVYGLLITETFGEFRYFKQQLRDMKFACPNVDEENICPACPKEHGTRVMSLDAIFGLKRWKKAKGVTTTPKHGTRVFEDQQIVDEYMADYKSKGKITSALQECNSFQAGEKTRAKIQSAKVDETGVFGSICRHEVPWRFFSLRQGESYGNAVFMIECLLRAIENTPGCNLLIMYDIACLLTKHLKRSDEKKKILDKIQMAVPAFHIYGHKPSCQVEYSPRRLEGFALSDGEQTERLWSFLRNFAKITREMSPANRIDTLTEALLHYTRNSINQIGEVLAQRFVRANKTRTVAEKELADALISSKGTQFITKQQIQKWASDEKQSFKKKENVPTKLTKEEKYVEALSKFYNFRQELVNYNGDDTDHAQYLDQQVKKLGTELSKHEKEHPRWGSNNPQYLTKLKQLMDKQQMQLLNRIHGLSCERWFLLKLKTRYADGQTMAQRICRQITAQTNRLKQSVIMYNNLHTTCTTKLPSKIDLKDAYNVESSVWNHLQDDQRLVGNGVLPTYVKRILIDLHHRIHRCEEELHLIKNEMKNVLYFYKGKYQAMSTTIGQHHMQTQFDVGVRALLQKKKQRVQQKLAVLQITFKECAGVDMVPLFAGQDLPVVEVTSPMEETVKQLEAELESSSGSDSVEEDGSCEEKSDNENDHGPLNELYSLVYNSYEEPLSSAESDLD